MQHDFVWEILVVVSIALGPIIADSICKDVSCPVKRRCRDRSSDLRVALQSVLGVAVPEVERAVTTGCAKGTVLWVE